MTTLTDALPKVSLHDEIMGLEREYLLQNLSLIHI